MRRLGTTTPPSVSGLDHARQSGCSIIEGAIFDQTIYSRNRRSQFCSRNLDHLHRSKPLLGFQVNIFDSNYLFHYSTNLIQFIKAILSAHL